MRNIKLISLAALALLAFACTKEQPEEPVTKPSITLKTADMTVGKKGLTAAAGSAASIEFSATADWTAAADVEWISLDVKSGKAGDAKIGITVAANEGFDERTGKVTITCGEAKASVTVNQNLNEVFGVAVAKNIDYLEQTLEFAVGTNEEYDINLEFAEGVNPWITEMDGTKAEPTLETVAFYVEANLGNTTREATLTIGNNNYKLQYIITQEGRSNTSLNGAAYLSNRQKPYDTDVWAPTTFAQYCVALNRTDKNATLGVVINVPKEGADKTTLPTGNFVCDAAGTHAPNTFSIKPADESEVAYTTIQTEESEILVMDGTINVTKAEKEYTIKCEVMDENGTIWNFKYVGEISELQDQSIGAQMFTDFYADYNTHFSSAVANQWNVECYISEAVPGVDELIYKLGFTLFGNGGQTTLDQIPEGEYTYAVPGTVTGYPKGNWDAAAFTFQSSTMCGYSEYNPDTYEYRYVDILDGKITIANVDTKEHTFDIAYDLDIKTYTYNWDTWEEEDVKTYDYKYSFEDVKYIPKDSGMRPILDEDQELTGCMISSAFTSYWYGSERFGVKGTNIFWFGFMNVNNEFTVTLPMSTDGKWTWVADIRDLYCSTPIPDGKYEFSVTPVANCLCNIGTPASRRGLISNGYTGSTAYVDGGSIEFTNGNTHIAIDLNATITYADQTTKAVHYTGGFDCSLSMHRNNSTKAITWAPHQTFSVGDKGGDMQIVKSGTYYKFPSHKYTVDGTEGNFVEIAQDGTSYFISDASKLPDASTITRISVVTASATGGEDYTIPASEVGAGTWFSWITSQGTLITDGTTIEEGAEYTLTNDPSWAGNSSNIGTNLVNGTKYASIVYNNNGDTVNWKLIEIK